MAKSVKKLVKKSSQKKVTKKVTKRSTPNIPKRKSSQSSLATIHYASGKKPKPAVNSANIRVYGHELCPFTQRARMTLAAKQIPFQKCEVDLLNKAEWHKNVNGGSIPMLETPEAEIIFESAVL